MTKSFPGKRRIFTNFTPKLREQNNNSNIGENSKVEIDNRNIGENIIIEILMKIIGYLKTICCISRLASIMRFI